MNGAVGAGAAIAAHAAGQREAILKRLREERATTSGRAIPFEPTDKMEKAHFEALVKCAIIRVRDGKVWLDEDRLADKRAGEMRIVLMVLLVGVIVALSVLAVVLATR